MGGPVRIMRHRGVGHLVMAGDTGNALDHDMDVLVCGRIREVLDPSLCQLLLQLIDRFLLSTAHDAMNHEKDLLILFEALKKDHCCCTGTNRG